MLLFVYELETVFPRLNLEVQEEPSVLVECYSRRKSKLTLFIQGSSLGLKPFFLEVQEE